MDKVYYYNRNGRLKITFNQDPYYMKGGSGEFKNHLWKYEEPYGRFKNFHREKNPWPFSVVIRSNNLADYDKLCDIFDEDVIAGKPGYFLINGWKLECFVTEATHNFFSGRDSIIDFKAVAEDPTWIRTNTRSYYGVPKGESEDVDYGRDYTLEGEEPARGYDYGYSLQSNHSADIDMHGTGNGYEVLVYGPASNPVIYLDNKPVKVNVTLTETQRLRLVSNGPIKTIKILSSSGVETDAFVYRNKESTPFLTLGSHTELTYGQIRFDFTTIERRSEPSWI